VHFSEPTSFQSGRKISQLDNSQTLLISNLHQLPAVPEVVLKLMSRFQNEDVNFTTLANTIAQDQGISAKVLRVANSSFYGLNREIGSIQSAVSVLGFVTLRSLVISAGAMQSFSAEF
jgi:HD-like signal output (HDOD) protein